MCAGRLHEVVGPQGALPFWPELPASRSSVCSLRAGGAIAAHPAATVQALVSSPSYQGIQFVITLRSMSDVVSLGLTITPGPDLQCSEGSCLATAAWDRSGCATKAET